jgi:23S rRNA pseudouridine1911/1915/1917 synthase
MSDRTHLVATIPKKLAGARLDQALAQLFPQYSRSRIQQWIRSGHASLDGRRSRQKDLVDGGERVEIQIHVEPDQRWTAEPIELNVMHEDESLLVVNKPAGLVVHPGAGNPAGTLVNALLHYRPALAKVPRAGIVHRLDKDTSGLMLVAKDLPAHKRLVKLIAERAVGREYEAIVLGHLISGGRLDGAIGRHPLKRTRMAVVPGGRLATTHIRVIRRYPGLTHLKARLETGRTHQIRVHLAHAGHPVVGDRSYGGYGKSPPGAEPVLKQAVRSFPRQALHAARLTLPGSDGEADRSWSAPLPTDMAGLLELARSAPDP